VLPAAYKSDTDVTSLLEATAGSDAQSISAKFKEVPAEEQVAIYAPPSSLPERESMKRKGEGIC